MTPYETFEHEGITVEIHYDEDGGYVCNPREGDQLTTFVCWHPDYVLGDEQISGSRGAVETPFHEGGEGVTSMRQVYRYIGIVRKGICILPLYLYDHSGISISAGSPNPFDNPRVRSDEFGQGMGWDTSMVGFVYTTHERISELCGDDEKYHSDEWIREQVEQDVRLYDSHLRGEWYGFVVAPDAEDEEACWGFLGDPDAEGGCKDEAKATAALIAKHRREARAHPWLPTFGNPILTHV